MARTSRRILFEPVGQSFKDSTRGRLDGAAC
jgi:hypothetical protein